MRIYSSMIMMLAAAELIIFGVVSLTGTPVSEWGVGVIAVNIMIIVTSLALSAIASLGLFIRKLVRR